MDVVKVAIGYVIINVGQKIHRIQILLMRAGGQKDENFWLSITTQ